MGHYDECMDADAFECAIAKHKQLVKSLRGRIKDMNLDDLQLVEEIINNIAAYKTFFYVLDKGRP